MKRTNIYLREDQAAALEAASRLKGGTRADLVRQMIDRDLAGGPVSSTEADLGAIEQSFGVLRTDHAMPPRAPDYRTGHLEHLSSP